MSDLRDLLKDAFVAGCMAAHENYQPHPDPDFDEAGYDYAASVSLPPAPDGATEGLAKMIDKRLFILSGPEGSGAYVKIGFADIKDASSAHAALASLSVSPVRPKDDDIAYP